MYERENWVVMRESNSQSDSAALYVNLGHIFSGLQSFTILSCGVTHAFVFGFTSHAKTILVPKHSDRGEQANVLRLNFNC